ncbi:DoxX family protein [Thioalkalivibrio sulfidiphilus HL-EbGr7]|uniref:DoxX family protein n=1 Tax=Thioalkalivibrio sulfidiphilus (strain HL-EbGR7) TaxID=396588 RepID=B8GMP7_THISH|nr:DoxX family protein [Thioalkalivibrio sulfidiphilus]ACL73712.1 DoxX family protein [Thioalkalivibrio sulfidiphilus HL-EbGr7]
MWLIELTRRVFGGLDQAGQWLAPVGLRLLLAFEFGRAGLEKLGGDNWFEFIKDDFMFPFNIIPVGLSWFLATWTEILAAIALIIGLGMRFAVISLIILDIVAWHSVHAGNGYNVCDNGWLLPLFFLVMLVTLLFTGPGKLSVDALIKRRLSVR